MSQSACFGAGRRVLSRLLQAMPEHAARLLGPTLLAVALPLLPSPGRAQPAAAPAAPQAAAPTAAAAAAVDKRPTLQRLRESGVIRVGHRTDALPFAYLDASKRPIGYGIDMCQEMIAGLKRDQKLPALRVEFVPVTAANRIALVRDGAVDVECGLTVNNAERRRDVAFSMPYFFAGPRILVPAASPIKDFADLNDKRVGSAKGANAVPLLQARIDKGQLPRLKLTEYANNDQAFAALEKGEIDAFVTTDNLLAAYRATAKQPQAWRLTGSALTMEPVAIMLRKDDPEFKAAVDKALAGMMLDGVAARLYGRWFTNPVPPANVVVDIPMSAPLRDQFRWPVDRAD